MAPVLAIAQQVPPTPATAAAFFDIDNTVVRGASAFHLGTALVRRGVIRAKDLRAFAWRHLCYLLRGEKKADVVSIQEDALRLVRGLSVADIMAVGEQVYDEVLAHRIYEGTQQLLRRHVTAGDEVWLVTASPQQMAALMARRLGATGAVGTVAESADGVFTGRLVGGLMHGAAKARAVEQLAAARGLDLAECSAYGDSQNDIPLLEAVGRPCGINPDRKLRRHCARAGWPLREFRGSRRVMRRSLTMAYRAGAVWAAFVALRGAKRRLTGRR
ncbi:MAG: HAD-IB family hydrolase [Bifidobacteriaceae bacterium]|jgi:HAD superfamily hydrolase (TIGR01490 family)|nr:HAD-IB family hydrolase [Bifidobacteriaceae bacterium]